MSHICQITGKQFVISEAEKAYCTSRGMPLPKHHPLEVLKWITSFRNRVHLYNSTCAFSGKSILSCVSPERGFTVYDHAVWNSDVWDAKTYAQDYDFSRSFFDQFAELTKKVPIPNLTSIGTLENSDYVNGALNLKNCYLTFVSIDSQDCVFCWNVFNSQNLMDSVYCYFCELCYEGVDLDHCYNVLFLESCNYCSDSAFLYNCQSCKNCYGCVNLNNKEYYWYNEALDKAEFESRMHGIKAKLGSYRGIEEEKKKYAKFRQKFPIKYCRGKNNENCTGNYLLNNKNCVQSYMCSDSQDLEHCLVALKSKDCFGLCSSKACELVYHSQTGLNYDIQYCNECSNMQRSQYCMHCVQGTTDCFGCVGLKKSMNCILNKQYTKEEYEDMVSRIKGQMIERGEWTDFFPKSLSPFYYNESDAMIFFPLTKKQALAQGFAWKDEERTSNENGEVIPDDIQDVSDDILNKTFLCKMSGKKFRIIKQELDFHKRMHLPLPHVAPLVRILDRTKVFAVQELRQAQCHMCHKPIESVYDINKNQVLCEECYVKTVY